MTDDHLVQSEQVARSRERCTVQMPNGWLGCDQLAGHIGAHTVWLTGFGAWTWPNKVRCEPR